MLNLVTKRYWFYLISLLVIVPGVISLGLWGIRTGVDFSSGTTMTIKFDQPVSQADLRQELADLGHGEAAIQRTGSGEYLVRTARLTPEQRDSQGNVITPAEVDTIKAALQATFGTFTVEDYFDVSPLVASESSRNAFIAVVVASIGIVLYIAWAFRKLSRSFRYGVCAIAALLHDTLVVLGVFSLLGHFFKIEVGATFIVAVLTVIGYSVNNTVVVFDRIRENRLRYPNNDYATTVNNSIVETLARNMNTSITTLITLAALLLFGGSTIRDFVLALFIGILSGTYSAIFNAAQLLVSWEYDDFGRWFRKLRGGGRQPAQSKAS